MKKGLKVFLWIVLILVILILIGLSYLGYAPAIASIFGWDKPKDLGITYGEEDLNNAREKSGVEYGVLDDSTSDDSSIQFEGTHEVDTSWSSVEATALLNDRPWKQWPIDDVQLKINNDNTVEMSGVFNRKKLGGYGRGIGVPNEVLDKLYLLPAKAPFYLKGNASLSNNSVSSFDISRAEMGRYSVPIGILLSLNNDSLIGNAYAEDLNSELNKYSGKKGYIVDFINEKLSWVKGFFANHAEFKDEKLIFQGSIPDKELSAR